MFHHKRRDARTFFLFFLFSVVRRRDQLRRGHWDERRAGRGSPRVSRAHLAAEQRPEERGAPLDRVRRGRLARARERDAAVVGHCEQEGLRRIDGVRGLRATVPSLLR
jgi:hypothetical protein